MKLKRAFTLSAALFFAVCGAAPVRAAQLSESDRRIYAEAFTAAKRGDWARAYRLAATAHDPLPGTALHWLQDKQPASGASFAAISSFIDAHPDWPARRCCASGPRKRSRRRPTHSSPSGSTCTRPFCRRHRLRQAQIWMAAGRKDDAVALIRQAWIDGDFTAVEEKLMLQRYRGVLRDEDNVASSRSPDLGRPNDRSQTHAAPCRAGRGRARPSAIGARR